MERNNHAYKASLLENELEAAESLLSTLKNEFEALNNTIAPEEISQLAKQKEQQLITMEEASQKRISIISITDSELSVEPLKSLWKRLLRTAQTCQNQNQINGGIINTTKRHIEQANTILNGRQPVSELRYDSSGETVSERQPRTLAKA